MPGHPPKAHEFTAILMMAAVVGAIAHLVGAGIEIGRVAGWWP